MKNVTAPGPTALLTEDEMLRVIGVCRATYRKMVKAGKGLPYVLVGKRRRYAWPAVLARLVENTTGEKSSK